MRKHPLYKGFILINKYPGCHKELGQFEPFTTGDLLKYPGVWKPVYHSDVLREIKINKILNNEESKF